MPFRIGPRQFLDFALNPRWSLGALVKGRPDMANFQMDGYVFDRTESCARANWNTLKRLCDAWSGKLVVKGILDVEDAMALNQHGVDAIQVSSHGARQLESVLAPITALADIRTALGDDLPLFYDSGLRSGEDVLKACAAGANFTFLGRILQFAIAAGGEDGLNRLWQVLADELSVAMAQTGMSGLMHPTKKPA